MDNDFSGGKFRQQLAQITKASKRIEKFMSPEQHKIAAQLTLAKRFSEVYYETGDDVAQDFADSMLTNAENLIVAAIWAKNKKLREVK